MVKLFNAVYAARRMPLCQDRSALHSTPSGGGIENDSRWSRKDLGCISVLIRVVKTEISGWRDSVQKYSLIYEIRCTCLEIHRRKRLRIMATNWNSNCAIKTDQSSI